MNNNNETHSLLRTSYTTHWVLSHARSTDLSRGRVTNADAALLALHGLGGSARSREIKSVLRSWRPGHDFVYLFNTSARGNYGYVGRDIASTSNLVSRPPPADKDTTRRTYWYRLARGRYAITIEGYRRLAELGVTTGR